MAAAGLLEKNSQLSEAAAIYQKIFGRDPNNQKAMDRLLVIYRKLKDYQKELAVLNQAIEAYKEGQKAARDKWIHSHPQAASASRSMLRQMGKEGDSVLGLGAPPIIERWIKRKDLVTGKITGKKRKKTPNPGKPNRSTAVRKKETRIHGEKKQVNNKEYERSLAAIVRREAAQRRRELAAIKQRERQERKAAETLRKKAEADRQPSLFVIILRYLVSLEKVDSVMKQHLSFLTKHYAIGNFLLSGRQVPRTGGIIIARARSRNEVEKIAKQDPFVKKKLASTEIIEFTASQYRKELRVYIKNPRK